MSESSAQYVSSRLSFKTDLINTGSHSGDAHESQTWPIFRRIVAIPQHGVHVADVVIDGLIDSPGTRALPRAQ